MPFKDEFTDEEAIARAFKFADLSSYPFQKRLLIKIADITFYTVIRLIGSTVRYEVKGWENWEATTLNQRQPIYTFWHDRVFASIYFWQKRGIVVMTSQSFDGEYIARFIQRFGAGAARGSSTRGGTTALAEMERLHLGYRQRSLSMAKRSTLLRENGWRFVTQKTGHRCCLHDYATAILEAKGSWDRAQRPSIHTRSRGFAPPIFVPGCE